MPLTVVASAEEIEEIEKMLQEICGGIRINRKTGAVMAVGPLKGDFREGCNCLSSLIGSRRRIRIRTLPSPQSEIPGSEEGPGKPRITIGSCRGGATIPRKLADAQAKRNGKPGRGSDTDVYIDRSNNNGDQYPETGDIRPPLWLILAHELTTGHAFHCARGTLPAPSGNAKIDELNRENQAIASENVHRRAHGLSTREFGELKGQG
jgi:hypothetical protein